MQRNQFARHSKLARYLTLTYLALVVYTSLYPFSEWHAPAEQVRAFLFAPWPRYLTWTDLLLNVMAYVPLGALLTLVFMSWMQSASAVLSATVIAALVSLTIEVLQVFLPGRIPANTDLLCNVSGALAGAGLTLLAGGRSVLSGILYRIRESGYHTGAAVDVCFLILALWLATQFNAEIRLFGNGNIRHLLPAVPEVRYSPEKYAALEAAITALNFCGVALMISVVSRSLRAAVLSVVGLMFIAMALKSMAAGVLFEAGSASLWLTSGAKWGIAVGAVLWLIALLAPRSLQIVCATTSLALGMALVNAAPENPYLSASLKVWQYGHYASLNELTSVISSLWPFGAIGFMTYLGYRLR